MTTLKNIIKYIGKEIVTHFISNLVTALMVVAFGWLSWWWVTSYVERKVEAVGDSVTQSYESSKDFASDKINQISNLIKREK